MSTVGKINSGTATDFRPMLIVQAKDDMICPGRQIYDIECVFINAGVDACAYQLEYVQDETYSHIHGLDLWTAPDPNGNFDTIGQAALSFLHDNLQ